MNKVSALSIILIGFTVGAIALAFSWFHKYAPQMQEADYQNIYADQLETEGAKLRQAEQRRQNAIDRVVQIAQDWQAVVEQRTPPPTLEDGGINLAVHPWQLTVDSRRFWQNMQRDVNRQMRRGGVTVISGPTLPAPPESADAILQAYYNYPTVEFPVVIFNLGQVTVKGSYEQITDHVRAWADFPNYLAVTDGLSISGTGRTLTGTYSLSMVAYIRASAITPPFTGAQANAGGGVMGQ